MKNSRLLISGLLVAWAMALSLVLSGCKPEEPPGPRSYSAGISGYNFTSEGVQAFFVNGIWASNLAPYVGGGVVCCVRLPEQWTPDLKVKVDWTIGQWTTPYETREHLSVSEQIACCWKERTLSKEVPIQRYGNEGGGVQVFFLPDDEIEVWVFDAGPQNPDHPSHRGYPERPAKKE